MLFAKLKDVNILIKLDKLFFLEKQKRCWLKYCAIEKAWVLLLLPPTIFFFFLDYQNSLLLNSYRTKLIVYIFVQFKYAEVIKK